MTTNTTAKTTVSHAKPAKAKLTKQEAAAAAVAKIRQASLTIAPAPAPSELVMMPLSLIETRAQVRTEFNDETLQELAEDIAARGVLQPILLRPNPGMANFLMIAGERRLRAARLAKLENIPAIIGTVDDDTAAAIQIAENIQREELSLKDEAAEVRRLYEIKGNSVTATAAHLHKSKSWVSKRLAASCPNLAWQASQLLEKGLTEDLEIVLTVNKIAELDYWEANKIAKAIEAGNAGRQTVRDELDRIKAEKEALQTKRKAEQEEYDTPAAQAEREAQQEKWKEEEQKRKAKQRLDPMNLRWHYDEELEDDQKKALAKHLKKLLESGKNTRAADLPGAVVRMTSGDYSAIEVATFVAGSQMFDFDLAKLIEITMNAEGEE